MEDLELLREYVERRSEPAFAELVSRHVNLVYSAARHVKSDFKSSATWHGCVASPLVTDKAVIVTVGGTNAGGVVALARDTGKTLWQVFDEKARLRDASRPGNPSARTTRRPPQRLRCPRASSP